jgi:DNA invertase Pin-like site-specific DNA recombinase
LKEPQELVLIPHLKIGYARVSTEAQNLGLQRDALEAAGCAIIYQDDGVSGIAIERDGLAQAISTIGGGDMLVVWKLDRLGRSLGFLCDLVERLGKQGTGFQSLTDGIDTTTNSGKLVFHIMGAVAESERALIRQRTKAGMKAAKKRERHVGRPKALNAAQVRHMQELLAAGKTQGEVATLLGISANTVSREVKRRINEEFAEIHPG